MKKCKDCKKLKGNNEYYGVQTDCKECTKKRVKLREVRLRKNPEWLEKERARQREKYYRLGYKENQKVWDKDKPWKKTSIYKNLNRNFKTPKGFELHHWNYNDEYLEDVVIMTISEHRKLHRLLELDIEKRIFKVKLDGKYLFSKLDHCFFIVDSGFEIVDYGF